MDARSPLLPAFSGDASSAAILADILGDSRKDYFLRSAAAYCLGRLGSFPTARNALIKAFSAQSHQVREDALAALADAGLGALTELFAGLAQRDSTDIQAGAQYLHRAEKLCFDQNCGGNHVEQALSFVSTSL